MEIGKKFGWEIPCVIHRFEWFSLSLLLQIFFTNIDAIQSQFDINQEYQTIVVRLKTLETCYFNIRNLDEAVKLTESLNGLINYSGKWNRCRFVVHCMWTEREMKSFQMAVLTLDQTSCDVTCLFPFSYSRDFQIIEDGWNLFSIELEFSQLKTISDDWRLTDVNKHFAVCSKRCIQSSLSFVFFWLRSVKPILND